MCYQMSSWTVSWIVKVTKHALLIDSAMNREHDSHGQCHEWCM